MHGWMNHAGVAVDRDHAVTDELERAEVAEAEVDNRADQWRRAHVGW